jgi:hypothetical protein
MTLRMGYHQFFHTKEDMDLLTCKRSVEQPCLIVTLVCHDMGLRWQRAFFAP